MTLGTYYFVEEPDGALLPRSISVYCFTQIHSLLINIVASHYTKK